MIVNGNTTVTGLNKVFHGTRLQMRAAFPLTRRMASRWNSWLETKVLAFTQTLNYQN